MLAKSGSKKTLVSLHVLNILLSFTLIVTNACQLGMIHQYAAEFSTEVRVVMCDMSDSGWSGLQVVRRGAPADLGGGGGTGGQLPGLHPLNRVSPSGAPGHVNLQQRDKRNAKVNKSVNNNFSIKQTFTDSELSSFLTTTSF